MQQQKGARIWEFDSAAERRLCQLRNAQSGITYDNALKEPSVFYELGHDEIYWIDLMYRDWQNLVTKTFESSQQRLDNAAFATKAVLHHMKNRHIGERLMFRVSKRSMRRYFRAHLPAERYLGVPDFCGAIHFWRRVGPFQYSVWWLFNERPATNDEW